MEIVEVMKTDKAVFGYSASGLMWVVYSLNGKITKRSFYKVNDAFTFYKLHC